MDNNIINSTGIVNGSLDDGIVYPYLFDYPAPEVPYIPTQTEINTNNISDLQTALVEKQDKLTAGNNITIDANNNIHATVFSGSYNDLIDKPSNFPPDTHNHFISDIENLDNTLNTLDTYKLDKTDVEIIQTNFYNIIQENVEFPREYLTNNTHVYNDLTVFRISASSAWTGFDPYNACDGDINTTWGASSYEIITGNCTLSTEYFTGYKGHYLMIDFGEYAIINSISIFVGYYFSRAPHHFRIYASNDDNCWGTPSHNSWVVIHESTDALTYDANTTNVISFTNNNYYKYYAIVINKVLGGDNYSDAVMMTELKLIGNIVSILPYIYTFDDVLIRNNGNQSLVGDRLLTNEIDIITLATNKLEKTNAEILVMNDYEILDENIEFPRENLTGFIHTYADGTVVKCYPDTPTPPFEPFIAFDETWLAFDGTTNQYGSLLPEYIQPEGTADAGMNFFPDYLGHYIMLDLGEYAVIKSLDIYVDNNFFRGPHHFRLYASNDDNCWENPSHYSWTVIFEKTDDFTYSVGVPNNTSFANYNYYRYYALVVNKIVGGDITATTCSISSLKLFGDRVSLLTNNIYTYSFDDIYLRQYNELSSDKTVGERLYSLEIGALVSTLYDGLQTLGWLINFLDGRFGFKRKLKDSFDALFDEYKGLYKFKELTWNKLNEKTIEGIIEHLDNMTDIYRYNTTEAGIHGDTYIDGDIFIKTDDTDVDLDATSLFDPSTWTGNNVFGGGEKLRDLLRIKQECPIKREEINNVIVMLLKYNTNEFELGQSPDYQLQLKNEGIKAGKLKLETTIINQIPEQTGIIYDNNDILDIRYNTDVFEKDGTYKLDVKNEGIKAGKLNITSNIPIYDKTGGFLDFRYDTTYFELLPEDLADETKSFALTLKDNLFSDIFAVANYDIDKDGNETLDTDHPNNDNNEFGTVQLVKDVLDNSILKIKRKNTLTEKEEDKVNEIVDDKIAVAFAAAGGVELLETIIEGNIAAYSLGGVAISSGLYTTLVGLNSSIGLAGLRTTVNNLWDYIHDLTETYTNNNSRDTLIAQKRLKIKDSLTIEEFEDTGVYGVNFTNFLTDVNNTNYAKWMAFYTKDDDVYYTPYVLINHDLKILGNIHYKNQLINLQYVDATSSIQTQLNNKAPTSHTHVIGDITNLSTILNSSNTQFVNTSNWINTHTHAIGDITNLQTTLDAKQNTLTAGTGIDITGNTISSTANSQWTTNGANIEFLTGNVYTVDLISDSVWTTSPEYLWLNQNTIHGLGNSTDVDVNISPKNNGKLIINGNTETASSIKCTSFIKDASRTTYTDDLFNFRLGADCMIGVYVNGLSGGVEKSMFGKQGMLCHIQSGDEFTVKSSGWVNLFGVEGGTGNVKTKGSLTVSSGGATIQKTTASETDPILHVIHTNGSQGIGIGYNNITATGTNQDVNIYSNGTGWVRFWQNTIERVRIASSGLLLIYDGITCSGGVGTFNDTIEVYGSKASGSSMDWRHWNFIVNNISNTTTGTIYYGIYSEYSVWTEGSFIASSDERIKKNIIDIDDDSALQKIMSIEPKIYNYIDVIKKGTSNVYGFIAQQIKEVIPEAVKIGTNIIPNIYQIADCSSNVITLNSNLDLYDITSNTTVKIIDQNNKEDKYIVQDILSSNTFSINSNIDSSNVFVYGTEVDDFHTLDKNYIFTLNVCATQELKRQNDVLKSRVDYLENQLSTLMEHIDTTDIIWKFK